MSIEEGDAAHIADMLEAGRGILEYTDGIAFAALTGDRMRCRAVEREFEILGEAARQLSAAFRNQHPKLPLGKVIGLRNVIAHGYAEVDYRVLFKIAREELPALLQDLQGLLPRRRRT